MSETEVVRVRREGDVAWVEIDNPPVNATSQAVRAGLARAVDQVADARVAVLACAGRTFIAGGDMTEFDAPPVEPHLPDVVQAIEDSPTPFVAALHGTVLGGGFEVAMGCAWRIAAPGTVFGLPEVKVGIIPGAGGSQRAPRLLGMELAIELAAEGRTVPAERVLAAGGLDGIAEGDLYDAVQKFIENLPPRPEPVARWISDRFPIEKQAKIEARLRKSAKGAEAPFHNLRALKWAEEPFEIGQPKERALHMELRRSEESIALRAAFFAERKVLKPNAIQGSGARKVGQVAIVGGGLMGAGIAAACLAAGHPVVTIERDPDAAEAARTRVHGLLDGALRRGRVDEKTVLKQRDNYISSSDYADASAADLAIEAVFEDLDAKRAVFADLARILGPNAILATNTSYLDPRQIFAGLPNSNRLIGLHFFSPAHVMKLVEVIRCPDASADVLATAFGFAKGLRKIPVLAGICDGFIGNRMLTAYRREAEYLLVDGALPHEIDASIRAAGLPMGPFELQDLTGLQIAWANRKRLAATRDPAERYVVISDTLCEMGRLGQRAGRGWYRYDEGSRIPRRDPEVEDLIIGHSADKRLIRREFTAEEISGRLLAVLANEGARIVEEGIAEDDAAIDVVQLNGYGFPRWRGGPMHLAGRQGWDDVAARMARVAAASPGSWILAERVEAHLPS